MSPRKKHVPRRSQNAAKEPRTEITFSGAVSNSRSGRPTRPKPNEPSTLKEGRGARRPPKSIPQSRSRAGPPTSIAGRCPRASAVDSTRPKPSRTFHIRQRTCPKASAVDSTGPKPSRTSHIHHRTGARELPQSIPPDRSQAERPTSTNGRARELPRSVTPSRSSAQHPTSTNGRGCPRASAVGHTRPKPSTTSHIHQRTGVPESFRSRSYQAEAQHDVPHPLADGCPTASAVCPRMAEAKRNVMHRPADGCPSDAAVCPPRPRSRRTSCHDARTVAPDPAHPERGKRTAGDLWEQALGLFARIPTAEAEETFARSRRTGTRSHQLPATGALGSVTCSSKPLCSSCGLRTPDDRTQRHDVAIMELEILTATPALPEEGRHDRPG